MVSSPCADPTEQSMGARGQPSVPDTLALTACPECDLLHRPPLPERFPPGAMRTDVCCQRCGAQLYRQSGTRVNRALALVITAWITFAIANAFPIATLDTQGHSSASTLLGAVSILWRQEMGLIASLVLGTTVLVPALELSVFGFVLWRLYRGLPLHDLRRLPHVLRMLLSARPWSMIEVFMLGVLVSLVKLSHLASLTVGVALWAYAVLMVLLVSISASVNMDEIWSKLPVPTRPRSPLPALPPGEPATAARAGWLSCPYCQLLTPGGAGHCPRCGGHLLHRQGTRHAWALLAAAAILFIPANLLPIMETGSLFGTQSDTILSGVVFLWQSGSWPLALLVFIASIAVPVIKLFALVLLLWSVNRSWPRHRLARTRLYRGLELIGRWSMLDIFVVTLLAALVQLKSLASITVGPGAVAFGAVVILTMLATEHFDPRLIWDGANQGKSDHV